MRLRTKLAGIGIGTMAVFMAVAGPAFAATVDPEAIAFTTDTAQATVPWVLGSGGYTFQATSCTGVDVTDNTGLTACSLPNGSNGTFTSVVCGTGIVFGNSTLIDEANGDAHNVATDATGHAYTIVFVAGLGVLVAGNVDGGAGAGVVQITPSPLPNPGTLPTGTCTTGFTVTAALLTTS